MDLEPVARAPQDVSVEQLRAQLAVARERTHRSFAALEAELRSEVAVFTDWTAAFQARPGLFLGAAFALGFLIGSNRKPNHP